MQRWQLENTLGQVVKKWRKDNDITQATLSHMIYAATGGQATLSQVSIMRLEGGKVTGIPTLETIEKLSYVIPDVDLPSWLIRKEGE